MAAALSSNEIDEHKEKERNKNDTFHRAVAIELHQLKPKWKYIVTKMKILANASIFLNQHVVALYKSVARIPLLKNVVSIPDLPAFSFFILFHLFL